MREQRLAYDEALSRVREVRFVEPNLGFEQQLRAWEQQLARERLPAAAQAWAEQATAALRGAAAACAAAPVQSEAAAKAVLGEVWRAWEASCGGEVDGRAASEDGRGGAATRRVLLRPRAAAGCCRARALKGQWRVRVAGVASGRRRRPALHVARQLRCDTAAVVPARGAARNRVDRVRRPGLPRGAHALVRLAVDGVRWRAGGSAASGIVCGVRTKTAGGCVYIIKGSAPRRCSHRHRARAVVGLSLATHTHAVSLPIYVHVGTRAFWCIRDLLLGLGQFVRWSV
mmetsp:Transcript_35879/g.115806  ORF Transcript_35879/g.115806 Transcript_35879/m.115806 type:complete len:286 (+) Transcript_35879:249-1106(+)